ncbi:MAG: HD domain-containing protein [Planctomycetota bacterium]
MDIRFLPETDLERAVCADPEWQAGAAWGTPRPGHPEGSVAAHVADVLSNVEKVATSPGERAKLRLIAILHDACKHRVDESRNRTGDNNHAVLARRLAERFTADLEILEVIELHDEAYNSWRLFTRGRVPRAEERIRILVERLGPSLPLYLRFFRADNGVPGKDPSPTEWFESRIPPASCSS